MKTHVTLKGVKASPELDGRLAALEQRVAEAMPDARFAKFVVEDSAVTRAVGLVVSLADGDTWVRHAHGGDWEKAFLELDRRLDRFEQES